MSLREEIRAAITAIPADPLAVPTPELPEHDGKIFVRRVSSDVTVGFWRDALDERDENERALAAATFACDSAGNRIFVDDDALWLGQSPVLTPVIERLYSAALHHNGLTEESRGSWRKNLPATVGTGSPSTSAAPSPTASTAT